MLHPIAVLGVAASRLLRFSQRRFGELFARAKALAQRVDRGQLLAVLAAVAALEVVFGPSLWAHLTRAANPDIVNDDARQQIYPFFRYEDFALFPNDFIGDYYLACLPVGFRALYTVGAWAFGAAPLSKVVPYALLAITLVATVLAARRIAGFGGGLIAAGLILSSGLFLARMSGGLPRAFGFPIVALTLLALIEGRPRLHAACVIAGAAFYPAAAVPAGLSLTLLFFFVPAVDRGAAQGWSRARRCKFLAGTALAAALLVAPTFIASRSYGPVIRAGDTRAFPESGPGGRYGPDDRAPFSGFFRTVPEVLEATLVGAGEPLLPPLRRWLDADEQNGASKNERYGTLLEGLLVLVLSGWAAIVQRSPGGRRLLCLPFAALIGYTVARAAAPHLYLPQRYVLLPVPLTAIVLLATAGAGYVPRRAGERRPYLPPLAAALLGVTALLALGGRGSPKAGLQVELRPNEGIYAFARSQPESSLFAGFPAGVANNIPYASRRPVLVSSETHQAFHAGYVLEMRRRTTAVVRALYAEDLAPLLALRRQWGVTHFYYRRSQSRGKALDYFRPFDEILRSAAARASGKPRVVESLQAARVFEQGDLVVLDLRKVP